MSGPEDLPNDVAALKAIIVAERLRSARLQHLLDALNRMHFGKRSEKMSADQLLLTFEDTDVAMAEADQLAEQSDDALEMTQAVRRTARAPDAPRPSLPSHLPRYEMEIAPAATAPRSSGRCGAGWALAA